MKEIPSRELLELAERAEYKGNPDEAAALRSYAELVAASEYIRDRNIATAGRFYASPIDVLLQQATEAGWPGLEEL